MHAVGESEDADFLAKKTFLYENLITCRAEDAGVVGFRSDKDVPLCRNFDSSVDEEITIQDLEWCNPDVSEAQLKAGLNPVSLRKLVTRTIEVCGE